MPGTSAAVKRVLLGRPRARRQLEHQLLPRWLALPVFSSDPLSKVAYATQEMMIVLALAGTAAFVLVGPLSGGVAVLLVIVVVSYRQTVRAYPHGGEAYIVAKENLGERSGLVAAAALLVDYVLTVAVSTAAGVAAVVSAFPGLAPHRVALALLLVALVTLANLRGARESGVLFAVPTYSFVVVMATLIVVGVARCVLDACPVAPSAGTPVEPHTALTLFLVLRAFTSGAVALTGVGAISNGVPAFRYPQSRNAASTLAVMGAIAVTLFLGTSFLAVATGVVAHEGMTRTVVAEIAIAVFGVGPGFYVVLAATAAILVLAANTAYADFPRLSSVLARDRHLPRQFLARGDRLMFSNGIVVLAVAAALVLVAFDASVTRLVKLYVLGVFTSFTLAQLGMVRHWLRLREGRWQLSVAVNGLGATVTGVVAVVAVVAKFTAGAWVVLVAIPLLAYLMHTVRTHYRAVSLELSVALVEPPGRPPNHAVILLDRVDEAAARAVSYVRATGPAGVSALGVPLAGADLERRWTDLAPDIPLRVLQPAASRGTLTALVDALREESQRHPADEFTTAIVPETLSRSWWQQLREHRLALRLKTALLTDGSVVVADLTSPEGGPGPYTVEEPAEHHVVVLVAGVHRATMRALAYAHGLSPTSVRALNINLDTGRTVTMLEQWEDWGITVPLELVDSPFRSLSRTVRGYVREFAPDGRYVIVTCVIPELVVARWWHAPLHNRTALHIKAALLFERGVVVTSVPYRLGRVPLEQQRGAAVEP